MPGNGIVETPTRKRVRTGCLTCRRRRRKCDEGKPACANCRNKRIQCRYGVNLSFLPDNASSLGPEDIRSFPSPAPYPEIKFITNIENDSPEGDHELDGAYTSRNDRSNSSATLGTRNDTQGVFQCGSELPNEAYETTSTSPQMPGYGCSDEQLNPRITDTANHFTAFSPENPSPGSIAEVHGIDEVDQGGESDPPYTPGQNNSFASFGIDNAINFPTIASKHQPNITSDEVFEPATKIAPPSSIGEKELQLLKYYRYEVAPWLDICDLFHRFGLDLLIAGKTHRPLNDAIFAISCCRQELLQGLSITETSDSALYCRSSEALLTLDLHSHDQNATYTYTLLKYIDFMSSEPQDWKRQIQTVSSCLTKNLRFQAFSPGLTEAVFWNYVRMDLSASLVAGGNTTLLVHDWLPQGIKLEESRQIFILRPSMDDWARYAMLLCAEAIDLCAERNVLTGLESGAQPANFGSRWIRIWNEAQNWYRDRPIELISVFDAPADSLEDCSANVFPTAIFSTGCGILANQLHHTTALLLLQCKPRTLRLSSGKTSHVWHALQICGIAAGNDLARTWDFTLLASLLVAARVMTHKSQQEVILETLERVRKLTGWRVSSEINRLRSFWNLAGGRNVT